MKTRTVFGAAIVAALVAAPAALADFEVAFDMAGTVVEDQSFVYGEVDNLGEYAGRGILGIGVRDLLVSFQAETVIKFAWAMDLSAAGYGAGIFIFAQDGPYSALASETFNFAFDVSGYAGTVLPDEHYGTWNIGTFVGGTADNAVNVISGEMYYILDGDPIPTPGALALLGLAGIATRRRRA